MSLYAYCLLRAPSGEQLPEIRGIESLPVFPYRSDKYTMMVSRMNRDFPFSGRSLVEHGKVISRIFEDYTVLPMRFGTFFRSEKQIKEMIRQNRGELVESFCRLRGKSEMRLRLLLSLASPKLKARSRSRSKTTASKTGPATSEVNRDALSLDPDSREMASRVATRMRDVFRPVEDQVKLRLVDNNQLMLDCTHLIDSERVQAYRKLPASASRQVKDLDIRMSGPWPPYHFLPDAVRLPSHQVRATRSAARS